MLQMTTKAVQYLVFEGKNFLLLMSVTIKQSDVSNNVRMGVLCYCYTFCGPLSPDWSPLSLQPSPHSGSISTPGQLLGRGTRVLDLSGTPASIIDPPQSSPSPAISGVQGNSLCLDF